MRRGFSFRRTGSENLGDISIPTLNVSQRIYQRRLAGWRSRLIQTRVWIFRTSWRGKVEITRSSLAAGCAGVSITDINPNNFGGSLYVCWRPGADPWTPTINPITNQPIFVDSLERYRRTLLGQQLGRTAQEIRAMGGGASQFNISAAIRWRAFRKRTSGFMRRTIGAFGQTLRLAMVCVTRIKPISAANSTSPRAWLLPGRRELQIATKPPTMVIRAGGGIFYNRFSEGQHAAGKSLQRRQPAAILRQ